MPVNFLEAILGSGRMVGQAVSFIILVSLLESACHLFDSSAGSWFKNEGIYDADGYKKRNPSWRPRDTQHLSFSFSLSLLLAVNMLDFIQPLIKKRTTAVRWWDNKKRKSFLTAGKIWMVTARSLFSSRHIECPADNKIMKRFTLDIETREQRLTFPFPFVHLQSHVYQQPRPSGTTINRGNENSNLAAV